MTIKTFQIEKLIRDNIPNFLQAQGIIVHTRPMIHEEFIQKLKDKLVEEAKEVLDAKNLKELTEELADVLEVIHALSSAAGLSLEEIEKTRLKKRELKGGFEDKIYNSSVQVEANNPSIHYYLNKPNQYPEIEPPIHDTNCLFCQFANGQKEIVPYAKFKHCYIIKDQYPVSPGHILIIPYGHTDNWFTAKDEVQLDIIKALNFAKEKLDVEYSPHGYNIGANCGEVAGQSVMHLHVHLIPRYSGDMEDPKGGVRGVIPSKQKY